MAKFKNKYRIESNRRPNWDYSSDALYFITIVTQHRVCNLGRINENQEMELSEFGLIVDSEWLKSFEIRKELILHEYVIMPNHIHAIVEIKNDERTADTDGRPYQRGRSYQRDRSTNPENQSNSDSSEFDISENPEIPPTDIKRNMPVRLPKSISSFLAGFKSAVNTKIDDYIDENALNIPKYNRNNHFFQPDYHDHIIRNQMEYERIRWYIINNPKNWKNDQLKK
jgi:putative transposase